MSTDIPPAGPEPGAAAKLQIPGDRALELACHPFADLRQ